MKIVLASVWVFFLLTGSALAQEASSTPADLNHRPVADLASPPVADQPPPGQTAGETIGQAIGQTIVLAVPKGTPLHVALDKEVRVHEAGQSIHGRIVAPVYAFDKIVIPVGTEVLGQITKIDPASGMKRTEAALNADFTPDRK